MRKYGKKLLFMIKFWRFLPFLFEFYKSKKVKVYKKVLSVLLIVGYIMLPLDLIPDFITFFGVIDDILIVSFIFSAIIKMAPDSLKKHYQMDKIQ